MFENYTVVAAEFYFDDFRLNVSNSVIQNWISNRYHQDIISTIIYSKVQ